MHDQLTVAQRPLVAHPTVRNVSENNNYIQQQLKCPLQQSLVSPKVVVVAVSSHVVRSVI